MSYIKAEEILPAEIIKILQTYVDGKNIYIPKKQGKRQEWGTSTGIRLELEERNQRIYQAYQRGMCTREIAEEFCLSQKTIQRIIRNMR